METIYNHGLLVAYKSLLEKTEPGYEANLVRSIFYHVQKAMVETTKCESPIEVQFAVSMKFYLDMFEKLFDGVLMQSQKEIVCGDNRYRVDFLITATIGGNTQKVVIECDGHDYHERTKIQAQADKQRDGDLLAAGYKVMWFTGSEIFRDSSKCALEVLQYILPIFTEERVG